MTTAPSYSAMAITSHDFGRHSVERGKANFELTFGIDLEAEIVSYNRNYDSNNFESSTSPCVINTQKPQDIETT